MRSDEFRCMESYLVAAGKQTQKQEQEQSRNNSVYMQSRIDQSECN